MNGFIPIGASPVGTLGSPDKLQLDPTLGAPVAPITATPFTSLAQPGALGTPPPAPGPLSPGKLADPAAPPAPVKPSTWDKVKGKIGQYLQAHGAFQSWNQGRKAEKQNRANQALSAAQGIRPNLNFIPNQYEKPF